MNCCQPAIKNLTNQFRERKEAALRGWTYFSGYIPIRKFTGIKEQRIIPKTRSSRLGWSRGLHRFNGGIENNKILKERTQSSRCRLQRPKRHLKEISLTRHRSGFSPKVSLVICNQRAIRAGYRHLQKLAHERDLDQSGVYELSGITQPLPLSLLSQPLHQYWRHFTLKYLQVLSAPVPRLVQKQEAPRFLHPFLKTHL